MSAEMVNSEYTRYPQSSLELYSKGTTESFRFLSSSISAWIVGVLVLPFLKNFFMAIGTLIVYRQFSNNVENTCGSDFSSRINLEETKELKKEDFKLKKEDFKFLFLLYPTDLPIDVERRDGNVLRGLPVIEKTKCKNSCLGALVGGIET